MSESDLHKRAETRIGTVLCGKYRLDGVLGVGGMAVVFAATHRNQKRVAIKMLHPELSIHEELKTRFLREGYAANTVDHPGAVAVLDDDTAEDGAAFLVMERLEGDEVDRLWEKRGRKLDTDVVLALASQLLDVLAAGHAKSIIHRDIKPSNLYVTREGTLKVLDFGIARVRDAANAGASATSTGMMLGTPAYMAPEQALGKSREIDATTDLWSVGATMFALLSGHFVHEGESATQLVVMAATTPARSLRTVSPEVDPRVVAVVDRALSFERAARWPSALAMRDAVRATYAAVYGTKLGREPLLRLLGVDADVETASTMHAPSTPPPTPAPQRAYARPALTVDEPAFPAVPRTQEMPARPSLPGEVRAPSYVPLPGYAPSGLVAQPPGGPAGAPAAGATTGHPVSTERLAAGVPRRSPFVLPAVALGVAVLVGAGVWLGLAASPGPASSATPATATTQALTPPPLAPIPVPAPPPAPSVVPSPVPVSPPVTPPVSPPPVVPAIPAQPRAPTVPAPPSPRPPSAPSKPNCDPPFTIRNGIKVPKPECLN